MASVVVAMFFSGMAVVVLANAARSIQRCQN